MGDVYADIGQTPVRLAMSDASGIRGVCFAHVVPARRGRHLSAPYGPLLDHALTPADVDALLPTLAAALKKAAKEHHCAFVRMSPFLDERNGQALISGFRKAGTKAVPSPLHLLAEHVWYLPLRENGKPVTEESLRSGMRKTTRNLIGRAERDGVTVTASDDAVRDLHFFLTLHEETRRRHGFTPYSDRFFVSQTERFSKRKECTLYLARYQGNVIAASLHMHAFGETSYHHGASSSAHHKIPASYLLQWTAIKDALRRGDKLYNFWGIAPLDADGNVAGKLKSHPFGGVTLFKTGFGGKPQNLMHCIDLPQSPQYWITYGIETVRKWRRGF
jgi:peptidoglycan pentaglycine glycine transferase (the first glycine)